MVRRRKRRLAPVEPPAEYTAELKRRNNLRFCDMTGAFTSHMICGLETIRDEFLGERADCHNEGGVVRTANQMLYEIKQYAHKMPQPIIKEHAKRSVTGVLRRELTEIEEVTRTRQGPMPEKTKQAIREKADQLIKRVINYHSKMGGYCGYAYESKGPMSEEPLKPLPGVKRAPKKRRRKSRA